jgi:2'-5' RNA ligase
VPTFTIELDRLRSALNQKDRFNLEVRSHRRNSGLVELVAGINAALAAEGVDTGRGHSPHLTLCYGTKHSLV